MIVERLSKTYASATGPVTVFSDLSLELEEGRITVILGPSGCGKTTLLHLLAGILAPDAGRIVRDTAAFPASASALSSISSSRSPLSFIFQEPRLLAWMSAAENIDLVLQRVIPDRGEREARIAHVLGIVGLSDAAEMFPEELSGGMRQRVSIARAFAYPSRLILMDEPFQSLDLKFRIDLIGEYLALWRQDQRTTLMVTHDVREALLMADVVYLLSERPARVTGRFAVPGDKFSRSLGEGGLPELEQRIYKAMGIA
jgi:NitT/TauT family transport system ATP-binding protein